MKYDLLQVSNFNEGRQTKWPLSWSSTHQQDNNQHIYSHAQRTPLGPRKAFKYKPFRAKNSQISWVGCQTIIITVDNDSKFDIMTGIKENGVKHCYRADKRNMLLEPSLNVLFIKSGLATLKNQRMDIKCLK